MLRLRPSELTLTPDDVEETFRRIAQRRRERDEARSSAAATVVPSQVSGRPGHPSLRKGPQRAVRDAITALDNMPILGPHPHQAALIMSAGTGQNRQDSASTSERQSHAIIAEPSSLLTALHRCAMTDSAHSQPFSIPLRPRLHHSNPPSQTHDPNERMDAVVARSTQDDQVHPVANIDRAVDLRGGDITDGDRISPSAIKTVHSPSPLCRVHRLSSPSCPKAPGDPVKYPASKYGSLSQPVLGQYQGLLHVSDEFEHACAALELSKSHTVPHPRRSLNSLRPRSSSSGRAAAALTQPCQDFADVSPTDILKTDVTPKHNHNQSHIEQNGNASYRNVDQSSIDHLPLDGGRYRSTRLSSSDTNAAFSCLGSLPSGSRQTSNEESEAGQIDPIDSTDELIDTEVDPNSDAGRTAFDEPVSGCSQIIPRSPPNLSPLPSIAYTRGYTQTREGVDEVTHAGQAYTDAASAALQEFGSPLEDYADQYQRLARADLARQQTVGTRTSTQPYSSRAPSPYAQPRMSIQTRGTTQNLHAARAMAVRRQQLRSAHSFTREHPSIEADQPEIRGRGAQLARRDQRSSENAPVTAALLSVQQAHESQVQAHRAAFERLHEAVQAMQTANGRVSDNRPSRYSAPQATRPREMVNRPQEHVIQQHTVRDMSLRGGNTLSSSPPHIVEHDSSAYPFGQSAQASHAPVRSAGRHESHQVTAELLQHRHTTVRRRGLLTVPLTMHADSPRDRPLTALAYAHGSGTTSRRTGSPVRPTTMAGHAYRRMPAQQIDQENSVDAEMMPAMREQEAIHARYNEDYQHHVMDETPPRIGRFEHRMLSDL